MRVLKFSKDGAPYLCVLYKAIISVQRTGPRSMEMILAGAPTLTVIDMPSKEATDEVFEDIMNHMGQED